MCTNSDISEQWTEVSGATLYGRINYLKPDQCPSVNPTMSLRKDINIEPGKVVPSTLEYDSGKVLFSQKCFGIFSHAFSARLPLMRV